MLLRRRLHLWRPSVQLRNTAGTTTPLISYAVPTACPGLTYAISYQVCEEQFVVRPGTPHYLPIQSPALQPDE